jgi:hypothetical protein
MSNCDFDENLRLLPKPLALTPDQIGQVAAGTAVVLPVSVIPPSWRGNLPVPVLEVGLQGVIA